MLLTLNQIKALVTKLETARRDATVGAAGYCTAAHVGSDGKSERWEPKPRAAKPVGHVYPDGNKLETREVERDNGIIEVEKGVAVPLGVHGRGHLAIDPATGDVRCALCAKGGG